ncbi:MAG: hypothetical protein PHR35_17415 [Kiritimatiellae bacterium]|nr:hypothetical protein [Kiritimatiellia bacterium]
MRECGNGIGRHAAAAVLAGLMAILISGEALAQQPVRRAATGASVVRIRKMPKVGRSLLMRSPEFKLNVPRAIGGSRRPREWAVMDVIYDTAPEWVDELSFHFYVLAETRTPEGQKQFNYYETDIVYLDLERGEHVATVVLPPAAVLRYGDVVAFGVEISSGGQKLADDSAASIQVPATWWKEPRVVENPNVVKREGYLQDRSKTPFALANMDDYEAVK